MTGVIAMLRALFTKLPSPPKKGTTKPQSFASARKELIDLCTQNIEHAHEIRGLAQKKRSERASETPPVAETVPPSA